jgi:glycosyltransferase involved in cell wall biosynthesis
MSASGADPYLHEYFHRFRAPVDEPGEQRKLLFLLGSSGISGGTYVVLQHAAAMDALGWHVTLAVKFPDHGALGWHPALDHIDVLTIDEAAESEFDVAIATWWPTVYELPRIRARHFLYLVQSVEARFYGENLAEQWAQPLAELTYTFGIPIITIATWIQVYLALRHRAASFLVRNGINKDLYNPAGDAVAERDSSVLRVLIEGPLHVPMKNVAAAARLARAGGADEIWHMTGQGSGDDTIADRIFEQVPIESTPTIYRSCDVLVKLSRVEGMFGPPLEMFHCGGTALTYDVTGFEEYLVPGVNAVVIPTDDEAGVVNAIRGLKTDPSRLRSLQRHALATAARWPDWATSSGEFARFVGAVARQPTRDHVDMLLAIRGAQRDFR